MKTTFEPERNRINTTEKRDRNKDKHKVTMKNKLLKNILITVLNEMIDMKKHR